jgi:very-short-patch-repair endonuclease
VKLTSDSYVLTPEQRLLQCHLRELGLEGRFEMLVCLERKWRFDIACPEKHLAFEISGGNWSGGHRRGTAQEHEYEKLNWAQMHGWRVLQFTNRQVASGEAKTFIQEHLKEQP